MKCMDLHTHTTFCDGKNTPEEMVEAAIKLGMDTIGFSGHNYTFFDESYCMSQGACSDYRNEIQRLKIKYQGQIQILCGVEQDYYSTEDTATYDYVIGSVHYLKIGDEFIPVDESADILQDAVERHFEGDWYALAEMYFNTVSNVVSKTNADIIGHFDLITKFNEKENFFDEQHPRYITAWKKAVDNLIKFDKFFEINTGAISRGYKSTAFPSKSIIEYIKEQKGKLILSSDSHSKDTLLYGFEGY